MDAVVMCCDGDSDLPCIMESDKVKFCALSDITQSPSVIIPPCEEVHCSLGWYVWPSQWFFKIQVASYSNYNNPIVEGDKDIMS